MLVKALTVAVPPTLIVLSNVDAPVNVPVVPLIAPLLVKALTVAVPLALIVPVTTAFSVAVPVPVTVVPDIAPFDTNSFTVAVPATFNVLVAPNVVN